MNTLREKEAIQRIGLYILQSEIQSFFNIKNLERAIQSIDNEFVGLYSKARIDFIKNCLVNRFNQIFNF